MPDDRVAVALARIRELTGKRREMMADWLAIDAMELAAVTEELIRCGDWSRAALEAALEPHRPGRIAVLGSLCGRHEPCRYFSITSIEAAGVAACADCTATVYDSCAGCGTHVRLDQCPVRTAVSRELLGEESTDADQAS